MILFDFSVGRCVLIWVEQDRVGQWRVCHVSFAHSCARRQDVIGAAVAAAVCTRVSYCVCELAVFS